MITHINMKIYLVLFLLIQVENIMINKFLEDNNQKKQEEKSDIYLLLVNKKHKLPDDWVEKVELITARNILGREFLVERKTLEQFEALRIKLLEEGVNIELDSTYRSVQRKQELWEEFETEYGIDYCRKYVAIPGYSEHHTGLVVDVCLIKDGVVIDDNDDMIAEREIFAKVHERLADYGFILRYLEGKEDITGYSYEPWHLRYVGIEIAKEIKEKRIALEEYLGEI